MKITITSIQPPHSTNIFDGIKTIEWRKKPLPLGINHVYETKKCFGLGLVIGSINITQNIFFNSIDEIPEEIIKQGCVSLPFLYGYAGRGPIYGNVIADPKKFDIPRHISYYYRASNNADGRIRIFQPPQSYMYAIDKELL